MTHIPALLPLLLPDWMNPEWLIRQSGNWALWVVLAIIVAECAIFPVLPGDSLLFAVGMFIALETIQLGSPTATLWWAMLLLTLAAILGNVLGYWLGRLIGPPLFKPRSGLAGRIFDHKYVEKTHDFFEKYGNRALILARFVPFVRTFVTLIAGVGEMNFRKFITYTAIGGLIWAPGLTLLGFYLGNITFIHDNLEAALIVIVLFSLIPMVVEYFNVKRKQKAGEAA